MNGSVSFSWTKLSYLLQPTLYCTDWINGSNSSQVCIHLHCHASCLHCILNQTLTMRIVWSIRTYQISYKWNVWVFRLLFCLLPSWWNDASNRLLGDEKHVTYQLPSFHENSPNIIWHVNKYNWEEKQHPEECSLHLLPSSVCPKTIDKDFSRHNFFTQPIPTTWLVCVCYHLLLSFYRMFQNICNIFYFFQYSSNK